MTSSTTKIKAVSDGNGTAKRPAPRREGLAALRDSEAKSLISLVLEATRATSEVTFQMHSDIYDRESKPSAAHLQDQLCEALTCLETTDHYLRMLGSVLDERAETQDRPEQDGDPEDPGEPPF
jgi:hypothetical protein